MTTSALPLVPKLHLGTHMSPQLRCRPQQFDRGNQREMKFRGWQETFPSTTWERGAFLIALGLFAAASDLRAQDTNAPVAQPVNPSPAGIVVTTPAAARFDRAMAFFNAGQYADAVTALSDFVRDFPQDRRREEALYRLAESYRNLNRADDALAAYTFQVQTYPDGPLRINGELRRGAMLFDAGKFADAIAPLQIVADQGDGELQQAAKYLLGRSFLATQREADGRAPLQGLGDDQPPGKFPGPVAQALAELYDAQNKPPH